MSQPELIFGSLKLPVALLVFCGLMTACTPQDPVERVTEIRGQYRIELNAWLPQNVDGGSDEGEAGLDSETEFGSEVGIATDLENGDEGTETDDGADGLDDEGMSASTDILFDLVVYLGGKEALPGVTIDVIHADPFKKEKLVFKEWLDTNGMVKGETRQVSFVTSIDDFVDGDVFSVVVRSIVPPSELGDYREYQ